MIANQYSQDTFFSYDIQFPRDGQLQSDANPLLVFDQVFSLNPIGSKYSFNSISTPSDISSAINSLEDNSEANDKYIETKFNGEIKTLDETLQIVKDTPVATPDDITNVEKKISVVSGNANSIGSKLVNFQAKVATEQQKAKATDVDLTSEVMALKATIKNLQAQMTRFDVLEKKIAQIAIVDQKLTALSTLVNTHDSNVDGHGVYEKRIVQLQKDQADAAQKATDEAAQTNLAIKLAQETATKAQN